MTASDTGAVDRAERERRIVVLSGVFMAYVGLALYAMSDERITHFVSSAMVFTGALIAIPQLVAQALKTSRNS